MKTHKIISALLLSGIIIFSACKKDPPEEPTPTPTPNTGSVKIEFENMLGDSALIFNTKNYINANNDTFKISKLNYYISNIKLLKNGNVVYSEAESYHFINQADLNSLKFTMTNVPYDTYNGIQFMIGVDSLRNVSGAQSGALDPANGNFWDWNSGYIMLKFEGTSPQSGSSSKGLMFHVGGFSGINNTLKTVSPSFGSSSAIVSSSITPEIHIKADILELFTTPTNINFASTYVIHMPGTSAKTLADNYADMFSVEHIHN